MIMFLLHARTSPFPSGILHKKVIVIVPILYISWLTSIVQLYSISGGAVCTQSTVVNSYSASRDN